jgi:DNA-binding response OmpR family regulator
MERDTRKILVVDDEPEVREMLQLNLSLRGFDVQTARDGIEALAKIREWQPDAIILDVVMPKVDGFSLLPMIRRVTEAPVIMLTAKSELTDVVKGLESGRADRAAQCEAAPPVTRASRHVNLRRPQC